MRRVASDGSRRRVRSWFGSNDHDRLRAARDSGGDLFRDVPVGGHRRLHPEPLGDFMSPCATADECQSGMVCPDGDNASDRGNVGFVCTYECELDSECRDSLVGRADVECRFGICVQQCFEDSQCPASQSECRGSHTSCFGVIPPPHFCAQPEGFTC